MVVLMLAPWIVNKFACHKSAKRPVTMWPTERERERGSGAEHHVKAGESHNYLVQLPQANENIWATNTFGKKFMRKLCLKHTWERSRILTHTHTRTRRQLKEFQTAAKASQAIKASTVSYTTTAANPYSCPTSRPLLLSDTFEITIVKCLAVTAVNWIDIEPGCSLEQLQMPQKKKKTKTKTKSTKELNAAR